MTSKVLFGCMIAAAALLTVSCASDDLALEGGSPNEVSGEEVEVTFAISTETAQAVTRATRAGETLKKGPGFKQTVGRGSKVDMLIYAVYEKDGDGYVLLKQYGDGTIPAELEDSVAFEGKASRDGQTIVYDPFGMTAQDDASENNSGTYTIKLRLMRGKEYSIAFWAQSSATSAYVTANLEEVQVKYEKAANNDELRDAFCKVENFTLGADGSTRTVVLTRPLAQINVGTTGADYYNIATNVNPPRWVAYSEIKLKGVADKIDVVADTISSSQDNLEVTFERSIIPAYMYYEGETDENGGVIDVGTFLKNRSETSEEAREFKTTIDEEEFLFVKLIPKADNETETTFLKYTEKYPTIEKGEYLTETFKYLSMCYVLVPAGQKQANEPNYDVSDDDGNQVYKDPYTSSILTSLEVKFAEKADGNAAFPPVRLTQVPVHRNWRTNILGGLYDKEVPTEEDPDDPNSVFKLPVIWVDKDVTFNGDYNNYPANNDGKWTEDPAPSDEGNTGDENDEEEENEE